MQSVVFIIIGVIIVALVVVLIVLGMRASKLTEELEAAEMKEQALALSNRELQGRIMELDGEVKRRNGWLDNLQQDLEHYKAEAETRVKIERKVYRVLTLGMKATGKSSLTLKWANPLVDLGTIEGTKIEAYERTVSNVRTKDTLTEHVFEVRDWGGEHIVDAQQELIMKEIHGLLMVVDIGGKDARQVDTKRISDQLNEFNPQALKFFFSAATMSSCKSVILFINKSDLIVGTPAQAEAQAKALYAPLIDSLKLYATQIEVKVLVGSASYGHSTHMLFSHFVEQILPKSAYDNQLVQRMKSDAQRRSTTMAGALGGPISQLEAAMPAPQIPHMPQGVMNGHPPMNGQPPTAQPSNPQQPMQSPVPIPPAAPTFNAKGTQEMLSPKGTMRISSSQMPAQRPETSGAATAPYIPRPPSPKKG